MFFHFICLSLFFSTLIISLYFTLIWHFNFHSEFNATYKSKISGLPERGSRDYASHQELYEDNYATALKETEAMYLKRGHELAQIANPDNGKEFFTKVISYQGWGDKTSKFTTPKLAEIARAHLPNEE